MRAQTLTRKLSCPKCDAVMKEGVVLDHTQGQRDVTTWLEGPIEKSALFGVKVHGHKTLEVMTYRCTVCGYLESYAG